MDAYSVARLIEDIEATSSRTEKEKLVGHLAASTLGRFVLKWAYDPMITFGITPAPTESLGKLDIEFKPVLVEKLLQRLADRELTGNAAELEIAEVMQALNKDGARLLFLILSKDLKCGIAAATINAVMPGLIPVFAVMRAHPYEAKKVKTWPRKAEFKLDGQRNTFLVREGQGGFYTRTGKIVPQLDFFVTPLLKATKAVLAQDIVTAELRSLLTSGSADGSLNFMLDGEAMMGLFADTGVFRRKDQDALGAELHLYDIMSYADFDAVGSVGLVLEERRKLLREYVHLIKKVMVGSPHAEMVQLVPQFFVNDDAEVQAFFERARETTLAKYLARGNEAREAELLKITIDGATGQPKVLEGAMIKDPNGLYDKKKSNGWLKLKAEETEDLRIVGFFNGKPHSKYESTTGGVIVDRNGVQVHVGGGFSDELRDQIHSLWLTDAHANGIDPNPGYAGIVVGGSVAGELLGRLVEVEFHEVTPDGSLRHPRFIRFRDDKDGEVESKEAA